MLTQVIDWWHGTSVSKDDTVQEIWGILFFPTYYLYINKLGNHTTKQKVASFKMLNEKDLYRGLQNMQNMPNMQNSLNNLNICASIQDYYWNSITQNKQSAILVYFVRIILEFS